VEILCASPYPPSEPSLHFTLHRSSTAVGLCVKQYSYGSVSLEFLLSCAENHESHRRATVIVETKGRTLEETATLFDGEDATEKLIGIATAHAGMTHGIKNTEDEKSSASSRLGDI
jgi:hypothetical protein